MYYPDIQEMFTVKSGAIKLMMIVSLYFVNLGEKKIKAIMQKQVSATSAFTTYSSNACYLSLVRTPEASTHCGGCLKTSCAKCCQALHAGPKWAKLYKASRILYLTKSI